MKLYKNLATAVKESNEVVALKISLSGGKFPTELFMFPNLQELYLEGDCEDFPKIGQPWGQLRILSLKWPHFKGDLSQVLSLPKLENLKIIETPLSRITLPLGRISSPLKSLTMKGCGLPELPEEISMLQEVTEMNLTGNNLTTLPASFPAMGKLKRLNLDNNLFSVFPDVIGKMKALSHLSIDGNKFSDEEKARIQRLFNLSPN